MKEKCEDEKMFRRCEDEKMFYRPPLLEEPCAQTLSGKTYFRTLAESSLQLYPRDLCSAMVAKHSEFSTVYL